MVLQLMKSDRVYRFALPYVMDSRDWVAVGTMNMKMRYVFFVMSISRNVLDMMMVPRPV